MEVVFRVNGDLIECRRVFETITSHREFYACYDEAFKEIVVETRSGTAEYAKRVFYDTIDALTKEGKKVVYYG